MTCKDCIHEKVCDALIKSGCPYLDEEVPADAFCMEFRNTADVAPRAEVAREIFEEIEKTVNDCVVGKSLFKPAYFEFRKFNEHLAELKKKYTEAEPPKGGAS